MTTDQTPEERAQEIAGHLLRNIPDAAERYAVARAIGARMPWVRAVSAAQLVQETGSVAAAADALGITRQAVARLMSDHDLPSPRSAADDVDETAPVVAYGRWLAVLTAVTWHSSSPGDRDRLEKVWAAYLARPRTVRSALSRDIPGWIRRTGDRSHWQAMVAAADEAVDWGALSDDLSMADRARVITAMHQARGDL